MQIRLGNDWHKLLRKILRNPAVEVVAAIVVVLLAAWFVIQTEAERRATLFPLFFGYK
ncbi:MAG TPA: hypothetical protein VLS49_07565 [Usitatibacter sp.]|nr:hypothetical protein [Usitatibacter sp.]